MLPGDNTTQIIVTLVGAFTSPLVIFVLPGYLFFDHSRKNAEDRLHKWLSLSMAIIGVILLVAMTTISLYVIRVDIYGERETVESLRYEL